MPGAEPKVGEEEILPLVSFLVSSARDTVEAPAIYGAFRLVDAASRLIAAAAAEDHFLVSIRDDIECNKALIMRDREEFVAWLDRLLTAVAEQVRGQNLALDPRLPAETSEALEQP